MNRIDRRFAALRASSRVGLIPFITAGDPAPEATVPVMHALVEAGADLIELGVPFSDPMADGPVIQRASERAIARGVGLARVLELVAAFRERDAATPVVLMGYLNPIEIHGRERFCAAAAAAGVDGLLLVDLPAEEADAFAPSFLAHGLYQIFLAAPTTGAARMAAISQRARGFIYYVSFAGITGAAHLAADAVATRLGELRATLRVPLAVGFGVREPAQAAMLAHGADAVVIGSALVEAIAEAADAASAAREFLAPFRAALDDAQLQARRVPNPARA